MSCGDNFVIRGMKIFFYNAHSKTVMRNYLRMSLDDNLVIRGNENHDSFT